MRSAKQEYVRIFQKTDNHYRSFTKQRFFNRGEYAIISSVKKDDPGLERTDRFSMEVLPDAG